MYFFSFLTKTYKGKFKYYTLLIHLFCFCTVYIFSINDNIWCEAFRLTVLVCGKDFDRLTFIGKWMKILSKVRDGRESDERKGNWIIYLYLELLFKIGLKLDASNTATKFEKDIKGILATSTTKVLLFCF